MDYQEKTRITHRSICRGNIMLSVLKVFRNAEATGMKVGKIYCIHLFF